MAEVRVQVCYALPEHQWLCDVLLPEGATLLQAVQASGLLQEVPGLVLDPARVGIHGKLKAPDTVLRDRDRVEIYRPLIADPKESRRRRAGKRAG